MNRLKVHFSFLFVGVLLGGLISNAVAEVNETKLSLEEVSQLALKNNFEIQLAKYDAWIAQTKKGEAQSIYDTLFTAEVGYRNNQEKRTSTILGTKVVDNEYSVGLSKKLPTGTTISIDQSNLRTSTNSLFSTSPLVHNSALSAAITQELGRNFFGLQDRGSVKITLLDIENTRFTSLAKIEDDLAQVQKAYWELVLAQELITIEKDSVAKAKELFELYQRKLQTGMIEKPGVIASEANYKESLNELLLAQNNFLARNNILKLLLNTPEGDTVILPLENFGISHEPETLQKSLKLGFEQRHDYKVKENTVKSRKLNVTLKKNNLWPEINLTASLTNNGLGDHFSDSIGNISDEDNSNLFAGLKINIPLENTKARAQLQGAKLEDVRALLDLKYVERTITTEIKDGVRNCNILREVAVNHEEIAALQAQKLEEEFKRFDSGRSDTDTVIRFKEDLLESQRKAARAKNTYQQALIDLRVKEGGLLNKYWKEEL